MQRLQESVWVGAIPGLPYLRPYAFDLDVALRFASHAYSTCSPARIR